MAVIAWQHQIVAIQDTLRVQQILKFAQSTLVPLQLPQLQLPQPPLQEPLPLMDQLVHAELLSPTVPHILLMLKINMILVLLVQQASFFPLTVCSVSPTFPDV
jgi:hypothetical protein